MHSNVLNAMGLRQHPLLEHIYHILQQDLSILNFPSDTLTCEWRHFGLIVTDVADMITCFLFVQIVLLLLLHFKNLI